MNKKTCAAIVCAFLVLAIAVSTVLLGKKKTLPQPRPEEILEVTKEAVPEADKTENKEYTAELPLETLEEKAEEKPAEKEKVSSSGGKAKSGVQEKKPEPEKEIIVEAPIINDVPEKESLPPSSGTSAYEKLAEAVYNTADIKEQNNAVYISYSQPRVDASMHLTVKADIYDINGATLCRYVSDAGWLSDPSRYDASAKEVLAKMGVNDLKDKKFILVVKVGDSQLSESAVVWQLVRDYDGSRSLTKAYVH